MKFLKCLIAYKGDNYYSSSNFNANVNMTESWVMRPGDSFMICQYNYRGHGPIGLTRYNAEYSYGDWLGRVCNDTIATAQRPMGFTGVNWLITCKERNSGELYLEIKINNYNTSAAGGSYSNTMELFTVKPVEVIHDSFEKRIQAWSDLKAAFQQITPDNTTIDWNKVNQPVPMWQYLNTNGLIRNTRININKYTMDAWYPPNSANTFPPAAPSNQINLLSENYLSGDVTLYMDLIQSYIDIENRIKHFLQTCGETQPTAATTASQITSNYHCPTAHNFSNLPIVWCGGLYATPPSTTNVNGSTNSFCRSILSIKCGAASEKNIDGTPVDTTKESGYFNCVDEHNNLCGWCVPQTRSQQASNTTWQETDNRFPAYKAGIVMNDGGYYMSIHTSMMRPLLIDNSNAMNDLQNAIPAPTGLNFNTSCLPCMAIVDDADTLWNHMLLRWGYINASTNEITAPIYMWVQKSYIPWDNGIIRSSRDISESGSNFYGTWGSYGVMVSTFETNNGGNNVNDSTQIYSPIHCLIMPSITSDWPALDIYGINKSRTVFEHGITSYYEQDEGCFEYNTVRTTEAMPHQGPAAGSAGLQCIKIYKTIAMSTPNHLISEDVPPVPPIL